MLAGWATPTMSPRQSSLLWLAMQPLWLVRAPLHSHVIGFISFRFSDLGFPKEAQEYLVQIKFMCDSAER